MEKRELFEEEVYENTLDQVAGFLSGIRNAGNEVRVEIERNDVKDEGEYWSELKLYIFEENDNIIDMIEKRLYENGERITTLEEVENFVRKEMKERY